MGERVVGAYEVGSLLGTGTVGEVYRARHRDTGAPAVIKFLRMETAREPEIQRRFVREVAIAEKLNHPNIVRHYDCGLDDDQIYFAMELVECGTLKEVLQKRGRLPWREMAECAVQICAALDHAHGLNVIHRDLKPANLFLSDSGVVKVGDFGLARDLDRSRLTMEGQTVGTCRYMPPEQITGEADLTCAADLYALGCVLYQALAGIPPFDGQTIIEIFEAHLYNDATPLVELAPDCPHAFCDLVMRLLAKEPCDRPASAAAIRAKLLDILRGRGGGMKGPPRPASTATKNVIADDSTIPNLAARLHVADLPTRPQHSWKLWLIAAGVVAVIAIAVAMWW